MYNRSRGVEPETTPGTNPSGQSGIARVQVQRSSHQATLHPLGQLSLGAQKLCNYLYKATDWLARLLCELKIALLVNSRSKALGLSI